jgi:hypothetical protein
MAPVVDLSSPSDEEEPIHDTARDFKFAQRLFSELNRDLLESPAMAMSSSLATLMKKKRRHTRRSLPV